MIDILVAREIELHHPTAEGADPRLLGGQQHDPQRQDAEARKNARPDPRGKAVLSAESRHVVLYISTFLLLQNERRVIHSQFSENRTEQKRFPQDMDAQPPSLVLNPHDAEIAVVAAKLEPELNFRRCRRRR